MRIQARSVSLRCFSLRVVVALLIPVSVANSAEKEADGKGSTGGADEKTLVVCADPAAMPRTGRTKDSTSQGVDLAVAELLCQRLGRKLEVHWCAGSCYWRCLASGRCDMVVGQPHGSGPAQGAAWSLPYAGSRFGLVVPRGVKTVRAPADLRDKKVGIVRGTVAPAIEGAEVVSFKSRETLLESMESADLAAAFVDADFASWYLHTHPKLPLRRVAEFVPRQRWNVGFAVRDDRPELLNEINRALTQLLGTGEVARAFVGEGVAFRAAFDDTENQQPAYDTWKRIQDRGELVVVMDPANLPYSSAAEDRPGFDTEIARALAAEMGLKLRLEWLDVQRETAIGELLDRECDLALGAVVDPGAVDDEEVLAGKVIYSRPYYGTGYLLVTRKDGPRAKSLADLKGDKSRRLGTEAGSVADYRLRQQGYLRRLFRTQLAVLKALDDGAIDYAYLWANVGWSLHVSPEFDVARVEDYVPEHHWNVAVALRHGDVELKERVDAALAKLAAAGTIRDALARYHVPYFPPFGDDVKGKQASGGGAVRHTVADRGLEPQMDRRQRSRKRYGGLARIRAAGMLVVGLDQNNLPLSTAHPEPAGLDYEIAGLLAEKLGVSRSVYWAYSSHDSYPSKLAVKKRCDVMLGVMPDDRFAARVLYSEPYYFARFQFAVPSGQTPGEGPLGVERGVAVRKIEGRRVEELSSQEAVLAAVAGGRLATGYVISTRGHWLAHHRWPGKIEFHDPPDVVDRFPICVALRKTDADLKEAVDTALAELAAGGQLAEIFARWHIPWESRPDSPR